MVIQFTDEKLGLGVETLESDLVVDEKISIDKDEAHLGVESRGELLPGLEVEKFREQTKRLIQDLEAFDGKERAAVAVGKLRSRIEDVEALIASGNPVSEEELNAILDPIKTSEAKFRQMEAAREDKLLQADLNPYQISEKVGMAATSTEPVSQVITATFPKDEGVYIHRERSDIYSTYEDTYDLGKIASTTGIEKIPSGGTIKVKEVDGAYQVKITVRGMHKNFNSISAINKKGGVIEFGARGELKNHEPAISKTQPKPSVFTINTTELSSEITLLQQHSTLIERNKELEEALLIEKADDQLLVAEKLEAESLVEEKSAELETALELNENLEVQIEEIQEDLQESQEDLAEAQETLSEVKSENEALLNETEALMAQLADLQGIPGNVEEVKSEEANPIEEEESALDVPSEADLSLESEPEEEVKDEPVEEATEVSDAPEEEVDPSTADPELGAELIFGDDTIVSDEGDSLEAAPLQNEVEPIEITPELVSKWWGTFRDFVAIRFARLKEEALAKNAETDKDATDKDATDTQESE